MFKIIPSTNHNLNTRNQFLIPRIYCRTELFSNSFFTYRIKEWQILNPEIKQSESLASTNHDLNMRNQFLFPPIYCCPNHFLTVFFLIV